MEMMEAIRITTIMVVDSSKTTITTTIKVMVVTRVVISSNSNSRHHSAIQLGIETISSLALLQLQEVNSNIPTRTKINSTKSKDQLKPLMLQP